MELELARLVQRSLLPNETPSVAGLDVFAFTQPASRVGGDFYDYIDEPDKPFVFSVCDISGKGVPAALMVAMTRMVLRTFAMSQPSPTSVAGNCSLSRRNAATLWTSLWHPLSSDSVPS